MFSSTINNNSNTNPLLLPFSPLSFYDKDNDPLMSIFNLPKHPQLENNAHRLQKKNTNDTTFYDKSVSPNKINTAQGLRVRRVRLSVEIAREFFDLQDMLGFDKASQTLDWLFKKSRKAIKEIEESSNNKGLLVSTDSEVEEEEEGEEEDRESSKNKKVRRTKESRAKARERARERTRVKEIKTRECFLNQEEDVEHVCGQTRTGEDSTYNINSSYYFPESDQIWETDSVVIMNMNLSSGTPYIW